MRGKEREKLFLRCWAVAAGLGPFGRRANLQQGLLIHVQIQFYNSSATYHLVFFYYLSLNIRNWTIVHSVSCMSSRTKWTSLPPRPEPTERTRERGGERERAAVAQPRTSGAVAGQKIIVTERTHWPRGTRQRSAGCRAVDELISG